MTNHSGSSITEILEKIRPMVSTLSPQQRLALIQAIAAEELSLSGQDDLTKEQEAWFARPLEERRRYPGEFVAVKDGEVIDHDQEQRALTLRARNRKMGAVLIVHSDWDETPQYTFHSTQLDRG